MSTKTPQATTAPAERASGERPAVLDHELIDWAWAQPIMNNPGARIVLMCMARRVDDAWECTASQEEVAADAMMSSRSVRRHLEQLEAGGFIERRKRFDEKGRRLPDRCRLNPGAEPGDRLSGSRIDHRTDWPVANLACGSDQRESLTDKLASGQDGLWPDWPVVDPSESDIPSSDPADTLTSGQIGRASSSPTENYNNNPSSTKKGGAGGKRNRAQPSGEEHPRFAEWYAAYPLHDKRPQAVKAFNKAIAKVRDAQVLIDAAKRYAEQDPRVKRGFIKGPSVWLNNDCWNDAIPPDPDQQRSDVRPNAPAPALPPRDGYTKDKSKIFGTRNHP